MVYNLQLKNILKSIITIGLLYIMYSIISMSSHMSFSVPVDPNWPYDTLITFKTIIK
jgi:hypothetical protein